MASQFQTAMQMGRVFDALTAEIDRDMPITIALTFFRVAAAGDGGLDQGELQTQLKSSSSGLSRTLQTLSDRHYLKEKDGLGLIERAIDPKDYRRRTLKLTPKGRKLLDKVAAEMARK